VKDGFVFRSVGRHGSVGKGLHPNSIGKLIKRLVKRTAIEYPELYGGHSCVRALSLRPRLTEQRSADYEANGSHLGGNVHRYARADQEDKQTAMSKLGL